MKLKPKRYPDELFAGPAPLKLDYRKVEELKVNPANPKTHPLKQIKKLAASMTASGIVSPIISDENDIILARHGRLLAAKHLGKSEVPTLRFCHLTPAQKLAYSLADN